MYLMVTSDRNQKDGVDLLLSKSESCTFHNILLKGDRILMWASNFRKEGDVIYTKNMIHIHSMYTLRITANKIKRGQITRVSKVVEEGREGEPSITN